MRLYFKIITGSADGSVAVFYSPTHSTRGAKLCVVREEKRRAVDDYEINRPVITPHALPMFKDDQPRSSKRKREKLRKDPKVSHRPGKEKSTIFFFYSFLSIWRILWKL